MGASRDQDVWGPAQRALRLEVLGAATPIGRELSCLLLDLGHPPSNLSLVALRPHACAWQGQEIPVRAMEERRPAAAVVLLTSAHPRALAAAARALAGGARLVDLSGAYRGRQEALLVAPGTALPDPGVFAQLVALPQRSALLCGPILHALERSFGVEEASVVLLVSAAGDGARALNDLYEELAGEAAEPAARGRVGNVLVAPPRGPAREALLARELALALGTQAPLELSALRVDAERCDSVSFHVRLRHPAFPAEVARALAAHPGVVVVEEQEIDRLSPRALQGEGGIHVGRIRTGSRGAGSVCFFAVGDQLRVAASAALAVAARLAS